MDKHFLRNEITIWRRGVVTEVRENGGSIHGLTSWGAQGIVDIDFNFDDVRFVDAEIRRRNLWFGDRTRLTANGVVQETLRTPVIGDIVMFASRWSEARGLHATNWTFEVTYKEAENKLPRCTFKDCTNPPRLGKHCCTFHAPTEDENDSYEDDGYVPMSVIHSRARAAISDPDLADEAARMCPGDFIY